MKYSTAVLLEHSEALFDSKQSRNVTSKGLKLSLSQAGRSLTDRAGLSKGEAERLWAALMEMALSSCFEDYAPSKALSV